MLYVMPFETDLVRRNVCQGRETANTRNTNEPSANPLIETAERKLQYVQASNLYPVKSIKKLY